MAEQLQPNSPSPEKWTTEVRDLLASTNGHTPGPWSTGLLSDTRRPQRGDDNRSYFGPGDVLCLYEATSPYDEEPTCWRVLAQQNSNFRDEPGYAETGALIAAAPRMRELLAWALAELERERMTFRVPGFDPRPFAWITRDGRKFIVEAHTSQPIINQTIMEAIQIGIDPTIDFKRTLPDGTIGVCVTYEVPES